MSTLQAISLINNPNSKGHGLSSSTDICTDLPLHSHVEQTIKRYFDELEGHLPCNLYQTVLKEIEYPLLKVVMEETGGNQSKAAQILGLNRGTLRKKLCEHDIV